MPTRLSTDDILLKERPSYWNHLVSSVLGRLQTYPQKSDPFHGSISYSHLSTIPLAQVASTQLTVVRPEKYIQDPSEDFYKINFQLRGEATLRQQGRSAQLSPGRWAIYDNTRPYELTFHSDYTQLLFLVPRNQLVGRLPTIDLHLATSQSNQSGMGRLLLQLAKGALEESDVMSGSVRLNTGQMLLDMLIMSLASDHGQATSQFHEQAGRRVDNILHLIDQHLANRNLSTGFLAHQTHLSERTIQKLFAEQHTTVNQVIWERRVARCQADLADPRYAQVSIQEIAYRWGFRTQSHFSRLFKQQVGLTPSRWRKRSFNAGS